MDGEPHGTAEPVRRRIGRRRRVGQVRCRGCAGRPDGCKGLRCLGARAGRAAADRTGRRRRRGLLAAGGAVGLGALGWQLAPPSLTERVELRLGIEPEVFVPDAPEGIVRVERVTSQAMGDLDLFTAVPA